MNGKNLKLVGIVLMIIGVAALAVTMTGMVKVFDTAAGSSSASELAEGISGSLGPTLISGPFFLIGLILFLVGWFNSRKSSSPA